MTDEPAPKPILRYPTGWLLAVVDDRTTAAEAARAVRAAGIAQSDIRILTGSEGRDAFRALGASASPMARVIRGVQFMSMDQMPDLPTYEQAIAEGRTVIAVRPKGRPGGPGGEGRARRARRPLPELLRAVHDRGVLALARARAGPAGPPPALTAAVRSGERLLGDDRRDRVGAVAGVHA